MVLGGPEAHEWLVISRSQVALGNVAAKRPSLIIIFRKRDNARPVRVPGRTGLRRTAGIEAVADAFLVALIPEIAALSGAMAQAGKGADGNGVVSQHSLRIMAGSARPTFLSTGETPVPPVTSFPLCGGWEGSLRGGRGDRL